MTVGSVPMAAVAVDIPVPKTAMDRESWVQCDSCSKWRRVPKVLADALDEETPWFCSENPQAQFAACSVPQELSNEEIDRLILVAEEAELQSQGRVTGQHPAVWQLVVDNIYTHRARRTQEEDDIMICQCKPPKDGGLGCGPRCLNRLLNMECTPDYCPCGDHCSNQMFSHKQYANLDKRRAGAKGFGLFTREDLKAGQFVMEYVGEVLEEEEYMRRKEYYHEIHQRHYYFMNVGNGEVIDACRKGGLGRFINHSCSPNCETQKWLVHGELAIGLFALQDIPANSELTFDYNFERYGDKPLRCLCDSAACRGFVGGTQENIISREVYDPSDASLDLEPIMVGEKEAEDPVLAAILENEVGLLTDTWDAEAVVARLKELAAKKGVQVDWDTIGAVHAVAASALAASLADNASHSAQAAPADAPPSDASTADAHPISHLISSTQSALGLAHHGDVTTSPPSADSNTAADDVIHAADIRAAISSQAPDLMVPEGRGDTGVVPLRPHPHSAGQAIPDVAQARGDRPAPASSSMASSTSTATFGLSARRAHRDALQGRDAATDTGPERELLVLPEAALLQAPRRRSEVDRKLDALVGPSGKLRDTSTQVTVKFLRLFNLCDFSSGVQGSAAAVPVPGPAPLDAGGSAQAGSGSGQNKPQQVAGGDALVERGVGNAQQPMSSLDDTKLAWAANGPQPGRRHRGVLREIVQPTARQRARMADASLLLDVILKTTSPSARKQLCACGVVRQLQVVLGRCEGPQHAVVLRKVLRVVEALPLTADDLHTTTSAQGCFADTLRGLFIHSNMDSSPEASAKAVKLLLQQPLSSCSQEVQQQAAEANRARHNRLMGSPAVVTKPPPAAPAPPAQPAGAVLPSGRRSRFGPIPIQPAPVLVADVIKRISPRPSAPDTPPKRQKTEASTSPLAATPVQPASDRLPNAHERLPRTVSATVQSAPTPAAHLISPQGLLSTSAMQATSLPPLYQHVTPQTHAQLAQPYRGSAALGWHAGAAPTQGALYYPAPISPPHGHAPARSPALPASAPHAPRGPHLLPGSLPPPVPNGRAPLPATISQPHLQHPAYVVGSLYPSQHSTNPPPPAPHQGAAPPPPPLRSDAPAPAREGGHARSWAPSQHAHHAHLPDRHDCAHASSRPSSAGSDVAPDRGDPSPHQGPASALDGGQPPRHAGALQRPGGAHLHPQDQADSQAPQAQHGGVESRARHRRSRWDDKAAEVAGSRGRSRHRWDLVKLESGELPSAAVPPLSNGGTSHPLPGPPAQADQQLSPRAPSRSPSGHESPVTPPPDALEPTGAGLHDEGQGAMLGEPLPPLPPEAEPAPPLPQDSDDLPSVDEGPADAEGPLSTATSADARQWETPDLGFEAFVARFVQIRLRKYSRRDHPLHIDTAAASALFRKARRTIIDNERKAHNDRVRIKAQRPIERAKLERRIKDYIRDSVRRLIDKRGTAS